MLLLLALAPYRANMGIGQSRSTTLRTDFADGGRCWVVIDFFPRDFDDVFVILADINSLHGCSILGSSVNRGSTPPDGPPTP